MNRYKLVHLIATGGMGEVFLARSEGPRGFAKTLVIKRILRHLASEPQFVEMFLNEARLAAMLSHPNIVQIFELGEEEGTWYIAMEYIHGRTLRAIKRQLLQKGQLLSPVFAARVCAQALQGLHYAHTLTDESGNPLHVVHRDVSPDNVLVGFNGQVKVVDFGIAKAANAIPTTQTGAVKGKFSYMSPEQLLGQPVDARSDVYAMGVILYELLTGARPWTAPTDPALIHSILKNPPPIPREKNPALPEAMSELILRALEKDPAARFSDAEEMSRALERFVIESGKDLSSSQVGGFLKDLFGAEAAAPLALPNGPPSSGASSPSRPSELETRRMVAQPEARTEVLPTPSSTGTRRQVAELAAVLAPSGVSPPGDVHAPLAGDTAPSPTPISTGTRRQVAELATALAPPGSPPPSGVHAALPGATASSAVVAAMPSEDKRLRTGLVVAGVAMLFVGALVAAYFAGREDAQPDAQLEAVAVPPRVGEPGRMDSQRAVQPDVTAAAPSPVAVPEAPESSPTAALQVSAAKVEGAAAEAAVAASTPEPAAVVQPTQPSAATAKVRTRPERRRPGTREVVQVRGPGRVALRVSPWAEVVHAGKSLGITPMSPVTVPSGKQTFTLRNKDLGITRKVTVTVPAGGEVVLRADLFE